MDKRRFIEIVETETGEVVKRVEVTGHSEHNRDKVERGILRNMDMERFFTRDVAE